VTLYDHVEQARRRLALAGIPEDEARLDAELLARHVLGCDRATWLTRVREPALAGFAEHYEEALQRRARREPLAYITGVREFWGLDFQVTPAVLIPRPETELIVEEALAAFADRPAPARVIDAATGSGCLAIALAREFRTTRVVATDLSRAALGVACRNAIRLGVADRVRFVQTDLLAGLRGRADLVVGNPPYVASDAAPTLQAEVRDYEPRVALSGGVGGLELLRRLIEQAAPRLRRGGLLIMEFGMEQEPAVRRSFESAGGWVVLDTRRDLQDIPRVIVARREPEPGGQHGS
jgi:release factor glutamine methyltransferase